MSINISIEALPGKSINPSDVRRLLPASQFAAVGGTYVFPKSLAGGQNDKTIKVQTSGGKIIITGGNDRNELKKFIPFFESLLTVPNFGRTVPPDAGRLLK